MKLNECVPQALAFIKDKYSAKVTKASLAGFAKSETDFFDVVTGEHCPALSLYAHRIDFNNDSHEVGASVSAVAYIWVSGDPLAYLDVFKDFLGGNADLAGRCIVAILKEAQIARDPTRQGHAQIVIQFELVF